MGCWANMILLQPRSTTCARFNKRVDATSHARASPSAHRRFFFFFRLPLEPPPSRFRLVPVPPASSLSPSSSLSGTKGAGASSASSRWSRSGATPGTMSFGADSTERYVFRAPTEKVSACAALQHSTTHAHG